MAPTSASLQVRLDAALAARAELLALQRDRAAVNARARRPAAAVTGTADGAAAPAAPPPAATAFEKPALPASPTRAPRPSSFAAAAAGALSPVAQSLQDERRELAALQRLSEERLAEVEALAAKRERLTAAAQGGAAVLHGVTAEAEPAPSVLTTPQSHEAGQQVQIAEGQHQIDAALRVLLSAGDDSDDDSDDDDGSVPAPMGTCAACSAFPCALHGSTNLCESCYGVPQVHTQHTACLVHNLQRSSILSRSPHLRI